MLSKNLAIILEEIIMGDFQETKFLEEILTEITEIEMIDMKEEEEITDPLVIGEEEEE